MSTEAACQTGEIPAITLPASLLMVRIEEVSATLMRSIAAEEQAIPVPRDMHARAGVALVEETEEGPLVFWSGWRQDLGGETHTGKLCRYMRADRAAQGDEILVKDDREPGLYWRARVIDSPRCDVARGLVP